ncbi:MAG: hypothetical protein ACP5JY_01780 [Candidatus Nanoarchaeia archaeon]
MDVLEKKEFSNKEDINTFLKEARNLVYKKLDPVIANLEGLEHLLFPEKQSSDEFALGNSQKDLGNSQMELHPSDIIARGVDYFNKNFEKEENLAKKTFYLLKISTGIYCEWLVTLYAFEKLAPDTLVSWFFENSKDRGVREETKNLLSEFVGYFKEYSNELYNLFSKNNVFENLENPLAIIYLYSVSKTTAENYLQFVSYEPLRTRFTQYFQDFANIEKVSHEVLKIIEEKYEKVYSDLLKKAEAFFKDKNGEVDKTAVDRFTEVWKKYKPKPKAEEKKIQIDSAYV